MKITDVSSSTNVDPTEEGDSQENVEPRQSRRTLLEKYDIPIEQLDFDFVTKCSDPRKIEKILKILRSGEEGVYPDLQKCVELRLEKLNPNSKLLRVETPVLHTNELDKDQREALSDGLVEWLNEITSEEQSKSNSKNLSDIFAKDVDNPFDEDLPIRNSKAHAETESKYHKISSNNASTSNHRIKSWEYDKWDRFDVDAELTKMDISEMRYEEWEKREKPKVIADQQKIEKLMREGSQPKQEASKSYVEELHDDEEGTYVTTKTSLAVKGNFRRTNITIDDLNLRI